MENTRIITEIEKEVFCFLNVLRESGVTNMFGATEYILEEFPEIKKNEARELLKLWMNNFDDDGNYETIKC